MAIGQARMAKPEGNPSEIPFLVTTPVHSPYKGPLLIKSSNQELLVGVTQVQRRSARLG